MKKRLTIAICAAAVSIPAFALAGPPPTPEFGGKLEKRKNRYLGFDVEGSGKDRKITNSFIINVPFRCNDPMNNNKESGDLEKAVKVKEDGSFDKTIEYDFDEPRHRGTSGLRYRLAGELDGKEAEGFVEIEILGSGGCTSGKQDFVVNKPAPDPPGSGRVRLR